MKFVNILNEFKSDVGEAGFSSSARQMRGLNDKVKTIVILTAENPCAAKFASDVNKDRNKDLEKFLINALYGYRKVKGQYGNLENSFMVNNMTKGMAMKLGNQFQQESIVFGERIDDGDKVGMTFQLIITYNCNGDTPVGTVVGERKVFIGRENENDFYTEVKGRKFQIPFFDVADEVEKKDDEGNTIIGADGKPEMKTIGKTDYDKASWDGGKIAGSVYIPTDISPEDEKQVSEWVNTSLNENITEKAQWMRRGMIINLLKKYFD